MADYQFDDNLDFDTKDIMPQDSIKPFENGEYQLLLTEFDPKSENSKQDGYNMIFSFEIINSEDFNGLGCRVWLPWAKPGDENKKAGTTTESIKSAKMRRMKAFIESLGGTITKKGISVPDGATCKAYLISDEWERKDMNGNPTGEVQKNIKIQGGLLAG